MPKEGESRREFIDSQDSFCQLSSTIVNSGLIIIINKTGKLSATTIQDLKFKVNLTRVDDSK